MTDLNDDFMIDHKEGVKEPAGLVWGRLYFTTETEHVRIPREFTFSMDISLSIFLRDAMDAFIKEHEKYFKHNASFAKDLQKIRDNFEQYSQLYSDEGKLLTEEETIEKAREAFALLSKHFSRLWT